MEVHIVEVHIHHPPPPGLGLGLGTQIESPQIPTTQGSGAR